MVIKINIYYIKINLKKPIDLVMTMTRSFAKLIKIKRIFKKSLKSKSF
jgi:hypothetical protein